jgi:cytochrome c peroxidase
MCPSKIVVLSACVAVALTTLSASPPVPLGLDLYRPAPVDNPLTRAKIALGRRLFHERRLSRDGSLSCAGCHDPNRAFTNGGRTGRGINGARGVRNVPTLINRAWGSSHFWDGRAATLEQQALGPILNATELGGSPDAVVGLVRSADYRPRFVAAFGRDPTMPDVAAALASYVRTIVSGDSAYDRFVAGDARALGGSARRGFDLFRTRAHCVNCHAGPLLSDERFHNTGIAWRTGALTDEGRFRVTHVGADRGAFKTPTLREVARTAPYMHDGSVQSLDAVVDFYVRGGMPNPELDREIVPLDLSAAERKDLVAFLQSLTGRIHEGMH